MLRGWVRMVQPGHRTWPGALPHLLHDPIKLPAPRLGCLNALWTWNRRKGIITEMGGSRTRAPATQPAAPTTSPIHCLAEKKKLWEPNQIPEEEKGSSSQGCFQNQENLTPGTQWIYSRRGQLCSKAYTIINILPYPSKHFLNVATSDSHSLMNRMHRFCA